MTQTLTPTTPEITGSYLVLNHISWEMYEKLLDVFASHPNFGKLYHVRLNG